MIVGLDGDRGLDGVGVGLDGVAAAVREPPDQDAGFGLFEVPAGCLLGLVILAAQGFQVALASPAAVIVGQGVVDIAAGGGAGAAGGGAGPLPDLDEVPQ